MKRIIVTISTVLLLGGTAVYAQGNRGGSAQRGQSGQAIHRPDTAQQGSMNQGQQGSMNQGQGTQGQNGAGNGDLDRTRDMDQTRDRLHQIEGQADALAKQFKKQVGKNGGSNGLNQQLCDLSGSVRDTARQASRTMDRIHQFANDPALQGDAATQRDMDRLRDHSRLMADQLEQSLQVMKQMQNRMGDGND